MIKSGNILDLIFLITLTSTIIYQLYRAKKGKEFKLRTFAAIEAFEEGVARAVEQHRAVFFTPGQSTRLESGDYATMAAASFSIMRYLAGMCAKSGARFCAMSPAGGASALAAMQSVHKEAYISAGKEDQYMFEDTRFPSGAAGGGSSLATLEFLEEIKATTVVVIGAYGNDGMTVGEWGKTHDSLVISGTLRHMMMFAAAMMADYILIADEIYAAASVVSKDQEMLGALVGADILKWATLAVLLIGGVLAITGVSINAFLSI